jgi:hypothetical protein
VEEVQEKVHSERVKGGVLGEFGIYLVSLEFGSVTQRYSGEAVAVSSKCTESAMMKVLYAFECRN